MLKRLKIQGFKSLRDVELELPRLTVLFGPNAAGKSNFLDAIQALSQIATARTLADALSDIRGHPIEFFSFPAGGLPELLSMEQATFSLEADVLTGKEQRRYRYRVGVRISPKSGSLAVADEYLCTMNQKWEPKERPQIEITGEDKVTIRRKGKQSHPFHEALGEHYSTLSNLQYSGPYFRALQHVRQELYGWRAYYLDPRVAMRWAQPPSAVYDIAQFGESIAPYLYRLKAEQPKAFATVKRTLKSIVPSVDDLEVDLDQRHGVLDVVVTQGGISFSSRIISEGTLRVLALCAIAVNPWGESLLAFEEPENGVHPRRLELIADLLFCLAADQGRQLVITTHSLLFCDAILRRARDARQGIGLVRVENRGADTVVSPLEVSGPLFQDDEIRRALTSGSEDGLFESLVLRGMLDGG